MLDPTIGATDPFGKQDEQSILAESHVVRPGLTASALAIVHVVQNSSSSSKNNNDYYDYQNRTTYSNDKKFTRY
jgi:hypothetical protein